MAGNIQFYNIKHFPIYGLYKAKQVVNRILVAVKTNLQTIFQVIKQKNNYDTSRIVKINIWIRQTTSTCNNIWSL